MTVLCKWNNQAGEITASLDDLTFANFAEQKVTTVNNNERVLAFPRLTTTKLRSIYGMIMNIYTKINDQTDFEKFNSDIQYLKVKMAYEAGREQAVKDFLERTYLMMLLSRVTNYDKFILYCRYAESLVAYFKFYGGRDK